MAKSLRMKANDLYNRDRIGRLRGETSPVMLQDRGSLRREIGDGIVGLHAATVNDHELVAQSQGLLGAMGGNEQSFSCALMELGQNQVADLVAGDRIKRPHGLVQNQHIR